MRQVLQSSTYCFGKNVKMEKGLFHALSGFQGQWRRRQQVMRHLGQWETQTVASISAPDIMPSASFFPVFFILSERLHHSIERRL